MSKKKTPSSPIRYETTAEDKELDTFCQLEKALKEEENENTNQGKRQSVTFNIPDELMPGGMRPEDAFTNITQTQKNDFHEAFMELQRRLSDVKRREADLLRNENWIKAEKLQLQKERKQIEENKMITDNKLQNAEIINLRNKIDELTERYENEKRQWRIERQQLLEKISQQQKPQQQQPQQPKTRPKVTFITPDDDPPQNETNNDDEEEEIHQEEHHEEEEEQNIVKAERDGYNQEEEEEAQYDDQSPLSQKIKETKIINDILKRDYMKTNSSQNSDKGKRNNNLIKQVKKRQIIHDKYQLDFDYNPGPIYKEEIKKDGRKVVIFKDGSKGTVFRNGTKKVRKGQNLYIFYVNKDIAIEFPDKAVGYKYKETNAIELSLPDGSVIYVFPNGQKEKHYANGDKAIQFPNGTYKIIYPNGDYETHFPDGKTEALTNGKVVVSYE
ncbi:T-complex protein 10, putative [Trichomonas vaginalis G3]|uniref:T-complex protein 10, putative n=1 Tax=Trichomonas vaginalis (strain ATCC PRA-98 / G3) TaxID=412133 RepID=A2F9X5_TRIV3|nr:centriole elongation [Trichomonas vaginalis G3]EAX98303.1 T-complex protein 10, putative [Trichomonas vaginalis G3]KAI5517461.1 centriole elongation [Trichomonas vaginalis G3]|eukprot:XP_001311233.1 T-complex protein 10 [Trichomonas vaginalis G3]